MLAGVTPHVISMCEKNCHIMNIDVSAGVGVPLLDTQLLNKQVQIKSVGLAKWGTCSILQWIHPKTHVFQQLRHALDLNSITISTRLDFSLCM